MKISIITPSFNSGKCIERAIQSVLNQDYNNWEHIIVDAGSTDGTIEILEKYPHLKWISEPDKGVYDAMNKGIKMANGKWIYFLGADDRLYDNNVLINIMANTKNNEVIYGDVMSKLHGGRYGGIIDYEKIFTYNLCHQAIFIKKTVFEYIGLFNLKYKYLADWDHNLRWIFRKDINRKYINLIIAEYADEGLSSTYVDHVFLNEKRFLFIKYGWNKLNTGFLISLCKQEFVSRNSSIVRKMIILMLYLLIKAKHIVSI